MSQPTPPRGYKETTFQQLRSFHEAARLGSFAAAAASLGLSQPTVWTQVRALERDLGTPLIEPGRGGRLTEAGRILADLAAPAVLSLGTLKARFHELYSGQPSRLTLAATPRVVAEDLPDCLVEFNRRRPDVRLTIRETWEDRALGLVEAGQADLALVTSRGGGPDNAWEANRWLEFEHLYDLDMVLLVPPGHPLARKRRVLPEDLRRYPLVTAPSAFISPHVRAALEAQDVFGEHDHRIEALFTATALKYVQLGFGIALAGTLPGHPPFPGVCERPMSEYFGRLTILLASPKGAPKREAVSAFVAVLRDRLGGAREAQERSRRKRPEKRAGS